ncbi:MAG: PAS domain S-box protein [Nitrospiraceae bacterium]|nr:MAG: PAS domain S-box protein [Nitrospiraceae bacterium]
MRNSFPKNKDASARKSEEELKASQARLQLAVQASNVGLWDWDLSTDNVYFSPEWKSQIGYKDEEISNDFSEWQSRVHPDDLERALSTVKAYIEKPYPNFENEFRLRHKDGSYRWILARADLMIDEEGKPYRMLGCHIDITERKQAVDVLAAEKKMSDTIIESLPGVFYLFDEKGKFLRWNRNLEQVSGYSAEEISKMHPLDFFTGDDKRIEDEHIQEVFQKGLAVSEAALVSKDGHRTPFFFMCMSALLGGVRCAVGTGIDITKKKQAEEALRESEERYRLLFESNPHPMWVYDLETLAFLAVNDAAVRHYGYTRDDFLAMTIKDIRPAEDIPALLDNIAHVTEGLDNAGVWQHRKKDGTVIDVEITSHTLVWSGRNTEVVLAHDITGRKRAEEEKSRLEAQLIQAQKMESIGLLAGGIAHDFNNILSAIIGYGHIVKMKMDPGDPLQVNIDHILESANKAAALTRNLLIFSKKQMVNLQSVDMNEIIRRMAKLLLRIAGEDITIKTDLKQDKLFIFADSGQIEQVLMNLAANARDAMPHGGILTISSEMIGIDDIFIKTHCFGKPGAYALITIFDTGIGMNHETQKKIFDPFFTTKEVGKGTGLGLSIVYGIIKQHSGFINVYSEPGKGTTFRIYLPAITTIIEHKEIAHVANSVPERGAETILVAEDDESVRKLLFTLLDSFGYKVILAHDGDDAVNKFMEHRESIKLLMLDIIMPKKNGKEVYDEIRKVSPNIKALFVSGYAADFLHNKKILDEKEVNILYKPVSPNVLAKKVREVLDRKL